MGKHENLDKRGNTWYYRFKMHGNPLPFRGSCFTHDLREAKRVLREKMAEAQKTPNVVTVATTRYMKLTAMREWDFRRARLAGSEQQTIDTGLGPVWKRLCVSFDHAGEMTSDKLAAYCLRHQERGISNQTLKRDLWAAKRGYEYACETDPTLPPLGKLPTLGKSSPGKARGQELSLELIVAWLAHLKPAPQAKALIGLCTGIRAEELERYEASWLTSPVVDGTVAWVLTLPDEATKGKRSRQIVICREVADLLIGYAPFKINYRRAWHTASTRVGLLKPVSMRDLRTTFATAMGEYDYPATKRMMGHAYGADDEVAMLYQRAGIARLRRLAEHAAKHFADALATSKGTHKGTQGGSRGTQAKKSKVPNSAS
jgi:hypothetical protein